MKIEHSLKHFLNDLDRKGIIRDRNVLEGDEYQKVSFGSNDYLGFSRSPEVREFYQKGFETHSAGSSASSVLAGYHKIHQELEEAFCGHLNCEAALLFSSGYTANLGVMSLLGRLQIPTVIDKASHASIYDGLQLAQANFQRYPHQNIENMSKKLSDNNAIVIEGTYSMSGYRPDLRAYADIAQTKDSILIVDEAHSFGVMGPNGLGAVMHAGIEQDEVPLRVIPFGKSFGVMGAIVVGKKDWVDVLLQVARSCIYSTAISPAIAYGMKQSLAYLIEADEQRGHLQNLIEYFKESRRHSRFDWIDSDSQIQRIKVGSHQVAIYLHQQLQSIGIGTQLIRTPTVNIPETGLRICLTSLHSRQDIDMLFDALDKVESTIYKVHNIQ